MAVLFLNWTSHFSHLYDFPFHALFKIKPLFLSSNAYACLFCHSYIIHSFDVDVSRHKEWCCLCRTSLQRWLSSTAAYRRPPRYWNSTSLINEIETRIALSSELAKVPLDVTLWSRSLRRLAPAARSQMSSDWEAKCFFFVFFIELEVSSVSVTAACVALLFIYLFFALVPAERMSGNLAHRKASVASRRYARNNVNYESLHQPLLSYLHLRRASRSKRSLASAADRPLNGTFWIESREEQMVTLHNLIAPISTDETGRASHDTITHSLQMLIT